MPQDYLGYLVQKKTILFVVIIVEMVAKTCVASESVGTRAK